MAIILKNILTFQQHLETLEKEPERYCPDHCPHCNWTAFTGHGCYSRKPDRFHDNDNANDIPIPRFKCKNCGRTCSTLPECIAPRRWYPWGLQQWCLSCVLEGWSMSRLCSVHIMGRSTISRWKAWLNQTFNDYQQQLCQDFPQFGYFSDLKTFWTHWFKQHSLSHAMAYLNQQGWIVP